MEIKFTKTAEESLSEIVNYLELNWSESVKNKFLNAVFKTIDRITVAPNSFPKSKIIAV